MTLHCLGSQLTLLACLQEEPKPQGLPFDWHRATHRPAVLTRSNVLQRIRRTASLLRRMPGSGSGSGSALLGHTDSVAASMPGTRMSDGPGSTFGSRLGPRGSGLSPSPQSGSARASETGLGLRHSSTAGAAKDIPTGVAHASDMDSDGGAALQCSSIQASCCASTSAAADLVSPLPRAAGRTSTQASCYASSSAAGEALPLVLDGLAHLDSEDLSLTGNDAAGSLIPQQVADGRRPHQRQA